MKTPLIVLALCAAPLVHGLSITALESDCVTLYAEVTYGATTPDSTAYEEYWIPNSGLLSLDVQRLLDGWSCSIYPDDVEENDRFFLPFDFTTLIFQSVSYWISDYRVQNHGWGFTITYDDEPLATSQRLLATSAKVPDAGSTIAMLALSVLGLGAVRQRRIAAAFSFVAFTIMAFTVRHHFTTDAHWYVLLALAAGGSLGVWTIAVFADRFIFDRKPKVKTPTLCVDCGHPATTKDYDTKEPLCDMCGGCRNE